MQNKSDDGDAMPRKGIQSDSESEGSEIDMRARGESAASRGSLGDKSTFSQ